LIYLDSSAVLARLFGEGRAPPPNIWAAFLVSSGLLEYEVWNRIHARRLAASVGEAAGLLISRVRLVALTPQVLARALQPFPVAVRTLDALHLATIEFLRRQGEAVELASYDSRLIAASRALGIALADL
jgi:uncharacterized protein